jgi:hypothetical protein
MFFLFLMIFIDQLHFDLKIRNERKINRIYCFLSFLNIYPNTSFVKRWSSLVQFVFVSQFCDNHLNYSINNIH